MDWHAPEEPIVFQYLEQTLSIPERRAFEAHLQECQDCREELRSARRLEALTRDWTEVEPPTVLAAAIGLKLRPQTSVPRWLLAAAAAVIVGIGLSARLAPPAPTTPQLGFSTPPPLTTHVPSGLGEKPPQQTLAAANVWTTESNPSVIALSGQILTLGSHTHLEVLSHKGTHYLLRLSQGEVRIQEHGESIAVVTDHLRVDPLGTDYQVSKTPQHTLVRLFSGKVRVTSLHSGKIANLQPGQSVEFPSSQSKPAYPIGIPIARPTPTIPGPAYPQRAPTPMVSATPELVHTPPDGPLWSEHPQNWRPQPEFHQTEPNMRNPNMRKPEFYRPGQYRRRQRPDRSRRAK